MNTALAFGNAMVLASGDREMVNDVLGTYGTHVQALVELGNGKSITSFDDGSVMGLDTSGDVNRVLAANGNEELFHMIYALANGSDHELHRMVRVITQQAEEALAKESASAES
jgi:hypothetical protein